MNALFSRATALLFCFSVTPGLYHARAAGDDYRAQATAYVDGHLAGKDAATSRTLFASGDAVAGTGWVRNPALWCADLDLTCFSPWNSTEHTLQGGTLITRRHVLLAYHFSNPVSGTPPMVPGVTTIEFVARDNTLYTRTITTMTRVQNTDLLIATLNKDLPDKITPARIFPAAQGKVIPPGTPLIYTGQDKQALVGECVSGSGPTITIQTATVAGRAAWTTAGPARVGDSGSPIFLPIHGRAVLLCHFYFANGGPSTGSHVTAINAITGTGYPVTEAALASTDDPAASRGDIALSDHPAERAGGEARQR